MKNLVAAATVAIAVGGFGGVASMPAIAHGEVRCAAGVGAVCFSGPTAPAPFYNTITLKDSLGDILNVFSLTPAEMADDIVQAYEIPGVATDPTQANNYGVVVIGGSNTTGDIDSGSVDKVEYFGLFSDGGYNNPTYSLGFYYGSISAPVQNPVLDTGLPIDLTRFLAPSLRAAGETATFTATVAPAVPEPSTWAMMLIGFGVVGATLRRRALRVTTA